MKQSKKDVPVTRNALCFVQDPVKTSFSSPACALKDKQRHLAPCAVRRTLSLAKTGCSDESPHRQGESLWGFSNVYNRKSNSRPKT